MTASVNGVAGFQGNVVQGNFIGTDATGANPVPNGNNGIRIFPTATNNLVGGTNQGEGNLIAYNLEDGVYIDPGALPMAGESQGNSTVGNAIYSNFDAGVVIISGTRNLISKNSIFKNSALGIALGTSGPNINTSCNSSSTGPNNLQNAPVLTAGSGSTIITATATDPNKNTSEFSNAVQISPGGNILGLAGNFNSKPSTKYTIEFFSNTLADSSGYGQGQTYLGSTTVTTDSSCAASISDPMDTTQADMSVVYTATPSLLQVSPDFGENVFTSLVINNGTATAHNATFTDPLPAGLKVSIAYCNLPTCQSAVTTTPGTCSLTGNTVTCNLGAMAPGATATINIPVETVGTGTITNTVSVAATESDPNLANNTATFTNTSTYPNAVILQVGVKTALVNSPSATVILYGAGFLPVTTVTFNGTPLTPTLIDNQVCGNVFSPSYCRGIEVQIPGSLLTTVGPATIAVANTAPGGGTTSTTFTIAAACTYSFQNFFPVLPSTIENQGTTLIAKSIAVTTNVPSCPWTASSSVPWVVMLDGPVNGTPVLGNGSVDFTVELNTGSASRVGSVTVQGQTFTFTQDAASPCSYTLDSSSMNFSPGGGTGSIGITATTVGSASCTPLVTSFAPWITIPNSSSLLFGSGTASYVVAPNLGGPRTGNIMISGVPFTVTQDAQSCYFTLGANSGTFPTSPTTGTFAVTANDPSCAWTATSSAPTQLTVTAGTSGTGNGTMNYSVAANTGGPQTATITVGNQNANAVFTMNQVSADTCTFTLSPSSLDVPSEGTSNVMFITASYSFCKWSAASSDPIVLTLTTPTSISGMGNGSIYYAVGANTGSPRTLSIGLTAGCQTVTVQQDGQATSNPVPNITSLQPPSGAAGSAQFTLTVNGTSFVNGAAVWIST